MCDWWGCASTLGAVSPPLQGNPTARPGLPIGFIFPPATHLYRQLRKRLNELNERLNELNEGTQRRSRSSGDGFSYEIKNSSVGFITRAARTLMLQEE